MRPLLSLLIALLSLTPAAAAAPKPAPSAPYHSLTRDFARFYDETQGMPEDRRVAAFKARFAPLFPGFYAPADGQTEEQYGASIRGALANFAALRPRYEQAERDFPRAYAAGLAHFRGTFPGFKSTVPIWFVHSLGRMDGGTRTLEGRNTLIFGADVIAKIHDSGDIGPFLDHELFHVENSRWFPDCEPDTIVWCSLWQEGLATYVSGTMNRTTDPHMLMLVFPAPIIPAVDADWRGALCMTRGDLEKSDRATYAMYFMGGGSRHPYPARFGYYIGYRVMQRLGKRYSLAALDKMGRAEARKRLFATLDAMIAEAGGCPAH